METETEFTCYHSTSEKYYKSQPTYFKIKNYFIGSEVRKGDKGRKPGSLGYGIYAYKEKDLANDFSKKLNSDPVLITLKLKKIDELVILDFNDIEEQESFHNFRKTILERCMQNYGGLIGSNLAQHEMDGIIIELYISQLIKYTDEVSFVDMVICRTYTPLKKEKAKMYSFIPNGTELCLRRSNYIEVIQSEPIEGVS